MKNTILLIKLFVLLMIVGILLPGCNKDDQTVVPPDELAPPTNIKALSKSGSVEISWTASTASGGSSFAGYRLVVRDEPAKTIVDSITLMLSTDTLITGLTNGSNYSFAVRTVKTNNDVSVSDSLVWGPTVRYTAARIYEFDSPNPSGLQFSSGNVFSFTSSSPDNRQYIDLWIDGAGNIQPLLKSPSQHLPSIGWRATKLIETSVYSMDQAVTIPPASAYQDTSSLTIVASRVYLAIAQDGHYTRFEVSSNGLQGTYPNRYVDILIAYNSGFGEWAKR